MINSFEPIAPGSIRSLQSGTHKGWTRRVRGWTSEAELLSCCHLAPHAQTSCRISAIAEPNRGVNLAPILAPTRQTGADSCSKSGAPSEWNWRHGDACPTDSGAKLAPNGAGQRGILAPFDAKVYGNFEVEPTVWAFEPRKFTVQYAVFKENLIAATLAPTGASFTLPAGKGLSRAELNSAARTRTAQSPRRLYKAHPCALCNEQHRIPRAALPRNFGLHILAFGERGYMNQRCLLNASHASHDHITRPRALAINHHVVNASHALAFILYASHARRRRPRASTIFFGAPRAGLHAQRRAQISVIYLGFRERGCVKLTSRVWIASYALYFMPHASNDRIGPSASKISVRFVCLASGGTPAALRTSFNDVFGIPRSVVASSYVAFSPPSRRKRVPCAAFTRDTSHARSAAPELLLHFSAPRERGYTRHPPTRPQILFDFSESRERVCADSESPPRHDSPDACGFLETPRTDATAHAPAAAAARYTHSMRVTCSNIARRRDSIFGGPAGEDMRQVARRRGVKRVPVTVLAAAAAPSTTPRMVVFLLRAAAQGFDVSGISGGDSAHGFALLKHSDEL
ncbi:hypothetical protein FB451DRAFT_1184491 [Mycena latifolia]|nr:hypothetical protein FB451DRAFT_1184491 [Mycena latifolia]